MNALIQKDETKKSDKFWFVLSKNGGGMPTVRHDTKSDAEKEAIRLATKTGDDFYILKTVCIAVHPKPPVELVKI